MHAAARRREENKAMGREGKTGEERGKGGYEEGASRSSEMELTGISFLSAARACGCFKIHYVSPCVTPKLCQTQYVFTHSPASVSPALANTKVAASGFWKSAGGYARENMVYFEVAVVAE